MKRYFFIHEFFGDNYCEKLTVLVVSYKLVSFEITKLNAEKTHYFWRVEQTDSSSSDSVPMVLRPENPNIFCKSIIETIFAFKRRQKWSTGLTWPVHVMFGWRKRKQNIEDKFLSNLAQRDFPLKNKTKKKHSQRDCTWTWWQLLVFHAFLKWIKCGLGTQPWGIPS